MATNKVVYNGKTLIDLSSDTVAASTLVEGITAHNKSGSVITGTCIDSYAGKYVWKIYSGKIWDVTDENLGRTRPSDMDSARYCQMIESNDGYLVLKEGSTTGDLSWYSYKKSDINSSEVKSVYRKDWHAVYNGNSYDDYHLITIGSTYTEGKGALLGYISSYSSNRYPDGKLQNGYYYEKVSDSNSTSTSTSDATASASDILTGKTAYISSGKTTGTMKNNSAVTGSISSKTGSYTIPSGYHNGSGKVSISSTEQNKIIASNIKSGVSILGVTGSYTGNSSSSSSSNNNCEAYLVDVTNPTVSFKTTSGTIKAYGYAYETTKSQWGGSTNTTMYAFNGTNYYKSQYYGSPTATNITLGVSGGKLTGLPNLTSGTLLVTKGI